MQSAFKSALACSSLSSITPISRNLLRSGQWQIGLLPVSTAIPFRTKKTVATSSSDNALKSNSSILQPGKGKIYDKKPFKFTCIEGKSYLWCTCGWSKTQPFCDSTHKNPHFRLTLKPVRFIPKETKEYILCNCKQTSNRPFCDGTHKREDIQAAVKS